MDIVLGMIGALLTVIFLCLAGAAGWWLRGKAEEYRKPDPAAPGEAERKRLIDDQEAFRQQMNYNAETAYGMRQLSGEDGGDNRWL